MRIINRKPSRVTALALGLLPFVLTLVAYAIASHYRRLDNPADKLLPSITSMGEAFWRMAAVPDRRSGDLLLWLDTFDSLWRLGTGMAGSTLLAISLALPSASFPISAADWRLISRHSR